MTPDKLLARAVLADPSRPLITFYDGTTGERAELSVVTFANWVAKTANLLVDGLSAQPGQRVAVALPVHWQAAVWHAACWACGLVPVLSLTGSGSTDIAVVALDPDGTDVEQAVPQAAEVVGLGLGPLGLPRPDVLRPSYVTLDYDREIHGHGDQFRSGSDVTAERSALEAGGAVLSAGDLDAATAEHLRRWSLPSGARILSVRPFHDVPAIVAGLLGPLANAGGAVLCRRVEPARMGRLAEAENVTAVTGVADGVLPRLPRLT